MCSLCVPINSLITFYSNEMNYFDYLDTENISYYHSIIYKISTSTSSAWMTIKIHLRITKLCSVHLPPLLTRLALGSE